MNKSSKVLAIIALFAAVIGVTVGFAAFSNTLTISSSAQVNPNSSDFSVVFSGSSSSTTTTVAGTGQTATPDTATINNGTLGGPTISGLGGTFTGAGTITYSFFVRNVGEYDAYLNKVKQLNVSGKSVNKYCSGNAETGSDSAVSPDLLEAACGAVNVSVSVSNPTTNKTVNGFNDNISGHSLAKGGYEEVSINIVYNPSEGQYADGSWHVDFGDIQLVYDTVD